jgi:hypothetical protein
MHATDPFTGSPIPPGAPTVRCPRGHVHLPDSWQAAGNRCCYPGCSYEGDPVVPHRPILGWVLTVGAVVALVAWLVSVVGPQEERPIIPSRRTSAGTLVTPVTAPVTPLPQEPPTSVPLSPPPAREISVGTRARVTAQSGLNIRSGPGLSYNEVVLPNLKCGTIVRVIGGPAEADGFRWWQVELDDGAQGWCAANWLEPH